MSEESFSAFEIVAIDRLSSFARSFNVIIYNEYTKILTIRQDIFFEKRKYFKKIEI